MRQQTLKPFILAISVLSLTAVAPLAAWAQDQDRHDQDRHEQRAQERHDGQRDDQSTQRRDEQRDDQSTQRRDEHPAPRRDERRADDQSDPVARYRHDHPRASARCHDGFFTQTHDRDRACSKHGGIDVWIAL